MHTHTNTFIHACAHTCTFIHVHKFIHMCTHSYIHTHTPRVHIHTCIHTHIHVYVHTYICACTHCTDMCTHIHTYVHTLMRACIPHVYTHSYMHACIHTRSGSAEGGGRMPGSVSGGRPFPLQEDLTWEQRRKGREGEEGLQAEVLLGSPAQLRLGLPGTGTEGSIHRLQGVPGWTGMGGCFLVWSLCPQICSPGWGWTVQKH